MNKLYLWKKNRITGYWTLVREVSASESEQWLSIFQSDEPNEQFKLSYRRPKD
ncbi:hypothetical protein [Burkholderia territorii]|uniref:hypothetical protein n=1 Tax=Burkholderia territorii TaxID=1503055 RepID=UPI000B1FF101|nr:hypothetical protein [Burkholderia territorii]